jgi:hypothetical protein
MRGYTWEDVEAQPETVERRLASNEITGNVKFPGWADLGEKQNIALYLYPLSILVPIKSPTISPYFVV